MIGTVCEVQFGYAFIACGNRKYFCHASQMPIDEVGRRYLLPDEQVSLELTKHNDRLVAANVELCTPHEPVDLDSYFEDGHVQRICSGGACAFLLRPFGGAALLKWQNVVSYKSNAHYGVRFAPNQRWRYGIKRPADIGRPWLAVDAVELA